MQDSAAVLCALRDLGFADLEWNYLGINSAVEDSELSYAHRQLEPSRSGASGIEIQQPIPDLLLRHMRVPGNHSCETCGFWLEIKLLEVVQDINRNALALKHVGLGKLHRPRAAVYIAPYRGYRRDLFQFFEDCGIAHIARMNDVFCPLQRRDRLRPQ